MRRVAVALGYARAPRWVGALVGEVLDGYRDAPADRPRELEAFLATTVGWERGQAADVAPRVGRRTPVPTRVVRPRPGLTEVPDLAALARLLDVDQGELAWFADVRGLERTAGDEGLRHYRWRVVERPRGVRLLAAPKPRLREVQRRLLRHLLAPVPSHSAAHGCVPGRSVRSAALPHAGAGLTEPVAHTVTGLVTTVVPAALWRRVPVPADPATFRDHVRGRVAWAVSVDPVLGARLRDLAARIDWDAPGPA